MTDCNLRRAKKMLTSTSRSEETGQDGVRPGHGGVMKCTSWHLTRLDVRASPSPGKQLGLNYLRNITWTT